MGLAQRRGLAGRGWDSFISLMLLFRRSAEHEGADAVFLPDLGRWPPNQFVEMEAIAALALEQARTPFGDLRATYDRFVARVDPPS